MREHEMEGLRGRADALRAEGYVLDIRLEGYVVRRNDRFVGSAAIDGRYNGRSAAMKMDARIEHLKSAVILGEGHQARLDHLASFAVDRFVPNEGDTVLDTQTGLVGKATDFEDGRALIRAGEDDDGFAYDRVFSDLAPLSPNMKVFAAEVSFVRHGETYGMETLNVVARSDSEATKIAADISEDSGHNDSRIAGRRRRISVAPNPDFVAHIAEMDEARSSGPGMR